MLLPLIAERCQYDVVNSEQDDNGGSRDRGTKHGYLSGTMIVSKCIRAAAYRRRAIYMRCISHNGDCLPAPTRITQRQLGV